MKQKKLNSWLMFRQKFFSLRMYKAPKITQEQICNSFLFFKIIHYLCKCKLIPAIKKSFSDNWSWQLLCKMRYFTSLRNSTTYFPRHSSEQLCYGMQRFSLGPWNKNNFWHKYLCLSAIQWGAVKQSITTSALSFITSQW